MAGRVVVDILATPEEGEAAASVEAAPFDALVTPLICTWTLGLNDPVMLLMLQQQGHSNIKIIGLIRWSHDARKFGRKCFISVLGATGILEAY